MEFVYSVGPCDVTKKEDLEKLVKEIESKEKHVNLLGTFVVPLLSLLPPQYSVIICGTSRLRCSTSLTEGTKDGDRPKQSSGYL